MNRNPSERSTPNTATAGMALRPVLVDLILICFLLAASIKITHAVASVMDIALYDETSYLALGTGLLKHGLPEAELGPGYAVWYFLLHLIQPDNIKLYFLNLQVLTAAVTITLYLLMRRIGTGPVVSALASFLYLTSGMPIIWPRVSNFAVLEMLVCLLAATFSRSIPVRLAWASFALLIVTFTRPEYFTAFLVCCGVSAIYLARKVKSGTLQGKAITRPALALCASAILFPAIFGSPIHPHSTRQYVAFAQHFTLNYTAWNHLKTNAWTNTETIMPTVFGKARTVPAAFAANPGAMLRHLGTNIRHLPRGFAAAILGALSHKAWVLEVLAWLALIGHILWRRKAIAGRSDPEVVKALVFLSILIAIPTFISGIVLYPRPHYLLMQIILALVLVAYWASQSMPPIFGRIPETVQAFALGIAFVVIAPPYSSAWYVHDPTPQENVKTIQLIRSNRLKASPIPILEQEGGYYVYLPDNYSRVAQYAKSRAFDQFMKENGVKMIVVSPELLADTRFKDDAEFVSFLHDPSLLGFVRMHIGGTSRDLYIAKDQQISE